MQKLGADLAALQETRFPPNSHDRTAAFLKARGYGIVFGDIEPGGRWSLVAIIFSCDVKWERLDGADDRSVSVAIPRNGGLADGRRQPLRPCQ